MVRAADRRVSRYQRASAEAVSARVLEDVYQPLHVGLATPDFSPDGDAGLYRRVHAEELYAVLMFAYPGMMVSPASPTG